MEKQYCPYCMNLQKDTGPCPVCGLTAGNYVPSPHHLPLGTVLQNRYLVGRVLGEGGFGITYIGCDLRLEVKVAIKEYFPVDRATRNAGVSLRVSCFLGPSAKSYERGKQKFLSEARTIARMEKQQVVVGIKDFFEEHDTAYIVMEYIEGTTFSELVKQRGGRIPPGELFGWVEPLFGALGEVHEMGLIHRDISPDNLMLEHGRVRLLDFGCAREAATGDETLTITLKHGYAPLEQYQQKGQGPWTDVYALCATLYFCLVGHAPPQAMDRIIEDPLMLPSKLGVDLLPRQERALLKGLRVSPNRRYQTMKELWAALYTNADESSVEQQEERMNSTAAASEPPQSERSLSHDSGNASIDPLQIPEAISEPPQSSAAVPEPQQEGVQRTEDLPGTDAQASAPAPKSKRPVLPPQRLPRKAMGAVAVLLAAAILIGVLSNQKGQSQDTPSKESPAASEMETESGDGGARLSSSRDGVLEELLADDSVSSVTITSGTHVWSEELTITKPVLVEQGAELCSMRMTVEESGQLNVEGFLQVIALLRLRGSNPDCIRLGGESTLDLSQASCIWADNSLTVRKLRSRNDCSARVVLFDENAVLANGIHVSSQEELLAAAAQNSDIVIDGTVELELEEDIDCRSVLIPEGSSLILNGEHSIYYYETSVLLNRGTLKGPWCCWNGGAVLNFGTADDNQMGIWMQEKTLLLNGGTLSLDNLSRLWNNSRMLNLPGSELNLYSFGLMESSLMCNYGTINVYDTALETEPGLLVRNGSELLNGGELLVKGTLKNGHIITNFAGASILLQEDCVFQNDQLYNEGTLSGNAKDLQEGIIWGPGSAEINASQEIAWSYDGGQFEGAESAENEEQLCDALDRSEVSAVRIPNGVDLVLGDSLNVSKPLLIEGSLSFAPDAMLEVNGGFLSVPGGGQLSVYQVKLRRSVFVLEGALTVNAVGQQQHMELWESALLSRYGSLTFAEQDGGATLCRLRKSTLVCPNISGGDATQIEVGYQSSFFPNNSNLDGEQGRIYVSSKGVLNPCAESNTLRNATVDGLMKVDCGLCSLNGTIENYGEITGTECNVDLNGSLTNNGLISLGGWDEYSFHQSAGELVNNNRTELRYHNLNLEGNVTNNGIILDGDEMEHQGSWP